MATLTEKFKNRLTKKVFACPSCSKQLRVPIRPGKTLMVSCPRCQGQIQLSFKSPISELFQWEKGRTFAYNFRMLSWRFKALPFNMKAAMGIQLVLVLMLLQFLFSWAMGPSTPEVEPLPAHQDYVRKI